MDLSPLRKFEVLGPDAEALMQATVTRDVRRLSDGHVVYTAMCNEAGGMIDDATIFRIADTNFRFVGGSGVRRRLAPGAGRAPRPERVREGIDRPPPQRGRARVRRAAIS